jgi:hypothetical protein
MYLDRVDAYTKAHTAIQEDQQTTLHSKMVTKAPGASSIDLNFVSTYKKCQKSSSQAAHAHHGGYSSLEAHIGSFFGSFANRGTHFN